MWIVGELREFDFDFNKYVTTRSLQKEEGILFRHLLRMVLLLDEMANVPPLETTVETWEYPLDDLADRLTEACRKIDPQSTDELVQNLVGVMNGGTSKADVVSPLYQSASAARNFAKSSSSTSVRMLVTSDSLPLIPAPSLVRYIACPSTT